MVGTTSPGFWSTLLVNVSITSGQLQHQFPRLCQTGKSSARSSADSAGGRHPGLCRGEVVVSALFPCEVPWQRPRRSGGRRVTVVRTQARRPRPPAKAGQRDVGTFALVSVIQRARGECRSLRLSPAMCPLKTSRSPKHTGWSEHESRGSAIRGIPPG